MSAANADFELFRVFLEKTCGIVLGSNKQYLVSSRLNKLMEQQGIKSLGELVQRIQTQRGGLREMVVDAMTTNETLWFRDTYPFEVLKQRVLPELIKANGGQRLRIWSAACSSGQEPYSLSMAIDEFEKTNLGQLKAGVQIVATDLSGRCSPPPRPANTTPWRWAAVCPRSVCNAISTPRDRGAGRSSRRSAAASSSVP